MIDLDELEKLARKNIHGDTWFCSAASNPKTILALIERVRKAEREAQYANQVCMELKHDHDNWKARAEKAEALLRDLFTGDDVPTPAHRYDEPTEAWVEGWNASMYGGLPDNPYDPDTTKGHEWQDGYDAAERD